MADLIERAPAETPVTPGDGVQPPVTPPPAGTPPPAELPKDGQPPAPPRPPIDLDARLEEVLAEGRRVAELDKQTATRLKRAEELEAKFGALAQADPEALARYVGAHDHLTKKERAAAVKALLGKIDEDLLFDLAQDLVEPPPGTDTGQPKAAPPPSTQTLEEQVKAILAAREKEAEEARAAAEKKKTEEQRQSAQQQMDTFLTSSATFLKANLDQFPFIKAWGCSSERYQALLLEHAEKHHVLPEPQVLLQAMEDEHKAKWAKSPYAPQQPPPLQDLDAHVAATYERNKPPPGAEQPVTRPKTALELAREELQAYDREREQRIRYSQGR